MSDRKTINEDELKEVAGGAGIRNTMNFTDVVAQNSIDLSGGPYGSTTAKTMTQTTANPAAKKGFFAKISFFFKKKSAKNVASGKNATVVADNKQFLA